MESKSNKQAAINFLNLASKGESREAFSKFGGQNFKHHNPYLKGDTETLIKAMEENAKENPGLIFEVKRALQDGDQVAVHSHFKLNADHLGAAVIHIFRFDDNKIVEL